MKQLIFVAGVVALLTGPAAAHHSYSAFEMDREIQVEGVVERFEFVAPHSIIMVRAGDTIYRAEWGAPVALTRSGITSDVLKVGDRVVVAGNPHREIAQNGILNVRGVTRLLDNWTWSGRRGEPRTATPPPPR